MFQEIGQVVSAEGRKAQVRVKPSETCAQCGRCGLTALSKQEDIVMEAWNDAGAAAGDSVLIQIESRDYLTATFVVHIVPVLAGIAGYIAGAFVASQAGLRTDAAGAVGAIFSFLLSFAGIRAYDRKSSRQGRFMPRIVENLSGGHTGSQ
ncbi:MAG: SoxR reducing system RseC family protein [Bacillota bacterium]|nr:SoxR reducing system RseC family protein [Bacillota bacterium]